MSVTWSENVRHASGAFQQVVRHQLHARSRGQPGCGHVSVATAWREVQSQRNTSESSIFPSCLRDHHVYLFENLGSPNIPAEVGMCLHHIYSKSRKLVENVRWKLLTIYLRKAAKKQCSFIRTSLWKPTVNQPRRRRAPGLPGLSTV